MAYPALVSVRHTLEQQMIHYDEYPFLVTKVKLVLLQSKISTMIEFAEVHLDKGNKMADALENDIIDAAYRAEDVIESHFSFLCLNSSPADTGRPSIVNLLFKRPSIVAILLKPLIFWQERRRVREDLEQVLQLFDCILEEAMRIKDRSAASTLDSVLEPLGPSSPSMPAMLGSKNVVVGLDDDFMKIKGLIYQESPQLKFIPIVGMGGMGKTTLAKRLYEDSISAQYFDRSAWVVVSQEYSVRNLILQVLLSITASTDELHKKTDDELALIVHKELIGRRYLVVIDDVWSTKALDDLRRLFPDDGNKSRILLTTREGDIATYVRSSSSQFVHEMKFLDEDQSWILLQHQVFEQQSCPPYLEDIGKKIARTCQGLPLTIVVVAGLLKKELSRGYWESVSRNVSSMDPAIAHNCSKILALSYDHLPPHLKPCFLYMAAFPEDFEINVDRIVRLWAAEGFLKVSRSDCLELEEVGEGYLDDLIRRNLLLVGKRRSDGRTRTIRIHDLWRDICTIKSQEKDFLYQYHVQTITSRRRITTFQPDVYPNFEPYDDDDVDDRPTTRSLLIFRSTNLHQVPSSTNSLWLLRILDAPDLSLYPYNVSELVNLRYLAFSISNHETASLFETIQSSCRNLQTLIIWSRVEVRISICSMPQLRHLLLQKGCGGSYQIEDIPRNARETELQMLSRAQNLCLTDEVIKMLVNIRKLGLLYIGEWGVQLPNTYDLNNLTRFQKLQILKVYFKYSTSVSTLTGLVEFAFPTTLKKLTLKACRISWSDMTKIGSLPNLLVLKLKQNAFRGPSWYPTEGEFRRLRCLEYSGRSNDLQEWEADYMHFPSLERLVLRYVGSCLKEIPTGIGEISALKLIELYRCEQSILDSATAILEEQRDFGNEDLQVGVWNTFPRRDQMHYL